MRYYSVALPPAMRARADAPLLCFGFFPADGAHVLFFFYPSKTSQ